MIKVFLVEDEFVVREGIKNNINWISHGFEFCGEAGDGEQAFPLIQKLKPDIVITDIRMPFMNGLVLSRLIKKELPETEIIILSGYSEFEYAKEGIKIGVAEYVSKPISGNELLGVLDSVAVKVIEQKRKNKPKEKNENKDANIGDVDIKQVKRSKVEEFLKNGKRENTAVFVDEFLKSVGIDAMKSNLFRQFIVMDTFFCVSEFLENMRFSKDEIGTIDKAVEGLQSIEDTRTYIINIINKALELREGAVGNRYNNIVDDVMEYIKKNYSDEKLSLNVVASYIGFSPNHLSMIFSQQTGQTFIKYLTDFRMNKAKEMLRCTAKSSSLIGYEVGYRDPHYFSFLFRKTQGITPTQYRGDGLAYNSDIQGGNN